MNFIILFINKMRVVALTPALQPIDGVAVSYIDAAVALGNTINEMDKYYTQENYKDDAFAKGKTLHQTFLKNLEAFEPVAESYHAAIQEINDKRQLAELKNIEQREGKTFHYYSLAVMISAKQINNLISQEKFDVENMFAASEIKFRTLTGIKSNFRMQTPAGWSTTHFRERYASTTKWSMTIIACVKRF